MSMQQMAPIPPLTYHDDRVDIYLRIAADGNRYSMDIMAEGQSLRVPIDMSSHQLAELSNHLQEEMRKIARSRARKSSRSDEVGSRETASSAGDEKGAFSNLLMKLFGRLRGIRGKQIKPAYASLALSNRYPPLSRKASFVPNDKAGESFRSLAEVGHRAFDQVFTQDGAADVINYLMPDNRQVRFQIASSDFFLPWECLYPKNLDEPLDVESFWGMQHVISRVITRNNRTGFISPSIKVKSAPTVGLLTYQKLRAVREKEVPFFEKLDEDKRIQLFKLRALDAKNKRAELREFRAFWRKGHLSSLETIFRYSVE